MGRFDYLKAGKTKKKKKGKKEAQEEDLAVIYVRRETVRTAWKALKDDGAGAESLSELVEDLLLEWLNQRGR